MRSFIISNGYLVSKQEGREFNIGQSFFIEEFVAQEGGASGVTHNISGISNIHTASLGYNYLNLYNQSIVDINTKSVSYVYINLGVRGEDSTLTRAYGDLTVDTVSQIFLDGISYTNTRSKGFAGLSISTTAVDGTKTALDGFSKLNFNIDGKDSTKTSSAASTYLQSDIQGIDSTKTFSVLSAYLHSSIEGKDPTKTSSTIFAYLNNNIGGTDSTKTSSALSANLDSKTYAVDTTKTQSILSAYLNNKIYSISATKTQSISTAVINSLIYSLVNVYTRSVGNLDVQGVGLVELQGICNVLTSSQAFLTLNLNCVVNCPVTTSVSSNAYLLQQVQSIIEARTSSLGSIVKTIGFSVKDGTSTHSNLNFSLNIPLNAVNSVLTALMGTLTVDSPVPESPGNDIEIIVYINMEQEHNLYINRTQSLSWY